MPDMNVRHLSGFLTIIFLAACAAPASTPTPAGPNSTPTAQLSSPATPAPLTSTSESAGSQTPIASQPSATQIKTSTPPPSATPSPTAAPATDQLLFIYRHEDGIQLRQVGADNLLELYIATLDYINV